MDLALTPTQIELRASAREFMHGVFPNESLIKLQAADTGYAPESWSQLVQAGWFGLLVPERFGGAELAVLDAAVVFEEFGRGPLPLLVYTTAGLGVLAIRALGTEEQQGAMLPALSSGDIRLSPAITEADYGWAPESIAATLHRDGDGFLLNGTKIFVPDAAGASHFLVAARSLEGDEVTFVVVDGGADGIAHRRLPGFMDWQSEVRFSDVRVPAASVLGGEGPGSSWERWSAALETAIPLLTSYQVGSCQEVFDMCVAYSASRVQFGRPIGQFQRVQDHIIGLVNHLDAARWTTYEAIAKLEKGTPARASVHLAKAVTAEAHWESCNAAHEIHAGLGSDLQFGLAKHTYVSRSLYAFLGDPRWHREHLATELGW